MLSCVLGRSFQRYQRCFEGKHVLDDFLQNYLKKHAPGVDVKVDVKQTARCAAVVTTTFPPGRAGTHAALVLLRALRDCSLKLAGKPIDVSGGVVADRATGWGDPHYR